MATKASEKTGCGEEEEKDQTPTNSQGTIVISSSPGTPGTIIISSSDSPPLSQQSQGAELSEQFWVEDALGATFSRPVDAMMECIKHISDLIAKISASDPGSHELYEVLELHLETLMRYTDVIDNANDFFNIGGFSILEPLLLMPHDDVRATGLELIGDLAQNNDFCQEKIVEFGLLPKLFNMLDSEVEEAVCLKALYAISCLCRQNNEILCHLIEIDAFSVLLRTIQKPSDRLRTKCAFFMTHLCNHMPVVRDILYDMGIIQLLACLLQDEIKLSTEHLLSCLLAVVSNRPRAKTELLKPEHQIKDTIVTLREAVQDLPEYREIKSYLEMLSVYCYDTNLDEVEKNCEATER